MLTMDDGQRWGLVCWFTMHDANAYEINLQFSATSEPLIYKSTRVGAWVCSPIPGGGGGRRHWHDARFTDRPKTYILLRL